MEEEDHTVSRAKDQPGGQVQRMGELQALLARVQAATGPDRELDGRIWCWLEGHTFVAMSDGRKCWADYGDNDSVSPRSVPSAGHMIFRHKAPDRGNAMLQGFLSSPRYSASLDAALALAERVLPNTSVAVKRWASGTGDAEIGGAGIADTARARAKTPALALLAALLTALSHQQPHDQIREGEGQ